MTSKLVTHYHYKTFQDWYIVTNIELKPGKGGQIARSAGASAQVLGKEGKYVLIRLRSGEVRMILSTCRATIGQVGNLQHELVNVGKAEHKMERYPSNSSWFCNEP